MHARKVERVQLFHIHFQIQASSRSPCQHLEKEWEATKSRHELLGPLAQQQGKLKTSTNTICRADKGKTESSGIHTSRKAIRQKNSQYHLPYSIWRAWQLLY